MRLFFLLGLVGSIVSLAGFLGFRGIASINYKQDVGGHLERAASANTIEIAKQELDVAIVNMEDRDLTDGYTSIVYRTPDEDVGFWYANIVASRDNLATLPPDADHLTVSNELMKLRETLLTHGESGESVRDPSGISVYPSNGAVAAWGMGSAMFAVISFSLFASRERRYPSYR